MIRKLTLTLNASVIDRAKKHAKCKKISLSHLIENYLNSITLDEKLDDFEISPFVKSISNGRSLSNIKNWKEIRDDYSIHLEEKFR